MSGFKLRKRLSGGGKDVSLLEIIGANSVVFQVGDLIRVDQDGMGALVTTGDDILGVVSGVVNANGIPVTPDSGTLDTYTMTSDNETVNGYKVQYIPALADYLFFNDADASLTATMLFQRFDVNDENDVDVATGSDTTGQVQLVQRDPDGDADASKGLFRIVESTFAQALTGSGIEA